MARNPPKKRKRRRRKRRPGAAPDPPGTHWCSRCDQVLPVSEFTVHKRTGRPASWCKKCWREYYREWRKRNPEKARAAVRRYYHRSRAKRRAYRQRPAERAKHAARQLILWSVKTGVLKRPEACERCGDVPPPRRLHAHHTDYSRPLDVVWLCSMCHGEEHRKTREEGT